MRRIAALAILMLVLGSCGFEPAVLETSADRTLAPLAAPAAPAPTVPPALSQTSTAAPPPTALPAARPTLAPTTVPTAVATVAPPPQPSAARTETTTPTTLPVPSVAPPVEPPVDETAATQSDVNDELAQTYESFGNPAADTVIVLAQGGPIEALYLGDAQELMAAVDLATTFVVVPHQVQTLDPERFTNEAITFDEAKQFNTETVVLIADLVQAFVDDERYVTVVGSSFGAFVVQELLATQGNIADGYFLQVGRLDMPVELWEPFSRGRYAIAEDGVDVRELTEDEARALGSIGSAIEANLSRLAAGLAYNRYTELLAETDLTNVVYAYAELDEQVGRLNESELAFLTAKGATVIIRDGAHADAIFSTIRPALELLVPADALLSTE